MEMTVFNKNSVKSIPKAAPKISVSKNGVFRIGIAATELMGLKSGASVSLAKDADGNWYIFKDAEGFPLREDSGGALTFNSIGMTNELGTIGRYLIAGTPTVVGKVKYWGILIPVD